MGRIRKIRRVRRPTSTQPGRTPAAVTAAPGTVQEPSGTSILVVAPTALRTLFVSRMVAFEGVRLAGVAETEAQALERVVKDRPDVAVIDMNLTEPLSGLHLARNIQKVASKTGILILVKSLEGIDLRSEARTFGSSWSYMWKAMLEDLPNTEAVLKSVGSGVRWVDPQLKRVLAKVWNIAAQARDLERESLRDLISEQDLNYQPLSGNAPGQGFQSVSVGEGGRGDRFKGFNGVRRAS